MRSSPVDIDMHPPLIPWAVWLAVLGQAPFSAENESTFPSRIAQRAQLLRPSAAELRWQEIPWLNSLVEARETAQKERRPILIWATDDNPFGRC